MRYYGRIGYWDNTEVKPGLVEPGLKFLYYKGDVFKNYKKNYEGSKVNTDLSVSNSISIIADPYAREHFFKIKCVEWQGALWKVSSVDASQPPRLILELGELYDEELE